MTHVEFANDVVHLHNIEQIKSPTPRPYWEAKNLWFQSLDQHIPRLRFQQFQILWPSFTIANILKLLVLECIG